MASLRSVHRQDRQQIAVVIRDGMLNCDSCAQELTTCMSETGLNAVELEREYGRGAQCSYCGGALLDEMGHPTSDFRRAL